MTEQHDELVQEIAELRATVNFQRQIISRLQDEIEEMRLQAKTEI